MKTFAACLLVAIALWGSTGGAHAQARLNDSQLIETLGVLDQ
jgi:hypothetical protein